MAMQLMSRSEFENELRKAGLEPTEILTRTGRLWRTSDGQYISVPAHSETYPDSVLEELLRRVGKLYRQPTKLH